MTTNLAKPQTLNCLTYLLQLWEQGIRFTIISNENHYVGVNDKKIYELGDTFKKDLQLGYSLSGGNNYIPLVFGDKKRLKKIFELDDRYSKTLDDYFEASF